jgi:hypothetical protein
VAVTGPAVAAWLNERFGLPNNYTDVTMAIQMEHRGACYLALRVLLTPADFATLAAAVAQDSAS